MIEPEIAAHYALGEEEQRLFAGGRPRLELVRTLELLERVLPPPPGRVLDVGGGPGTYAAELARRGHVVDLVDPLDHHVRRARQVGAGTGRAVTAHQGDARHLAVRDGVSEATLLLGPLYHLVERADRRRAWAEAVRVTRRGGVVVAVGISRFASLLDGLRRRQLADRAFRAVVEQDLHDGQHRNPGGPDRPDLFTTAYFHRPEELEQEARDAGLAGVVLVAVEGPGWIVEDPADVDEHPAAARAVEAERSLLGASAHLMAVGRVQ